MLANKKRYITAKDLLALKFVRSVAISPDEKEILYVVEWMDEKDNKYYSNLWMVNTQTRENRQFTFGKVKDSSPLWSPNGKKIAFISKRGEKQGIFIINRDGGEAAKLIEAEGSFKQLCWSADGKTIVYSFRKAEIHKDKDGKSVQPVVREIKRIFYRLDGDGWLPKDGFHLWICDTQTGQAQQITKGKYEEHWPKYSPDGKSIALISNRSKDPDLNPLRQDIYIISSEGKSLRKVSTPAGPKEALSWSPDGKKIAYLGHPYPEDTWGVRNYQVWVVEPDNKNSARNLTLKLDRMCMDLVITDTGDVHSIASPAWSDNSRRLYFTVSDAGNSQIYSVDLKGKFSKILTGNFRCADFHLNGKTKKIAALISDNSHPGEAWVANSSGAGKPQKLTTVNQQTLSKFSFSKPEEFWFNSFDGTKIQAWIIKPPNFNPKKKYPAIVEIHGGPRVLYGNAFFHEFQFLTALGFVVFYSNPRGSQGYGEKFAGGNHKDWGNVDYKDIMAGVDFLCMKPYVDAKRLGVTGGSYGGYMTNWIVGHTHRFRAAITGRSVVNLVSFFGSSDFGFDDYREFGCQPWEDWMRLLKMSPIYYVKNIKTPLLILHNENDLRCHIEQAEQLFAALKFLKRKVEFVRFPEEFHGLSRTGRPDRRIERLNRIASWFKRYLK